MKALGKSAGWVASFEDRQRALSRKGRKVWATVKEHGEIKQLLTAMRDNKDYKWEAKK